MIVGKPQLLKNLNSDIVRDFIYREGPVSKPEIAVGTALSLPTVKKRVDLLLREGWIRETGRSGEGVGRKAVKYEADRSHNMILLLYKRGGFWAYLVDLTGTICHERQYSYEESGAGSYLEFLCGCIRELMERVPGTVLSIGVTVPGVVRSSGLIKHIPEIPEWEKYNLQEELQRRFGVDVLVENDTRMMTLGYYETRLRGKYSDLVYIFAENALSAGVVIGGRLHRGLDNFAGELGFLIFHENLSRSNQPVNGRGDFETSVMELQELIGSHPGDQKLLERYYDLLAKGIVTVGCATAPEIVVIQGKYLGSDVLRYITERIRPYFPKDVLPELRINQDTSCTVQGMIQECVRHSIEKSAKLGGLTIH